ncbi:MAG: DUF6064 family protein [Alphaproteobacteria bacterium]|nr:DUF6064 family protein [Alphaproteobacteria bacterium]
MLDRLIPYSGEVYRFVVADYLAAHWPLQAVALAIAVALPLAARRGGPAAAPAIGAGLAAGWLWVGGAYWIGTYGQLNWAGPYFGYAFLGQAALLALWAIRAPLGKPAIGRALLPPSALMGLAVVAGAVAGGGGPASVPALLSVGLTPLSLILVTVAILRLAGYRMPLWLLPVPFASLIWEGLRAVVHDEPFDGMVVLVAAAALVAGARSGRNRKPIQ